MMTGETDLSILLGSMSPVLHEEEYVFISVDGNYGDHAYLEPLCSFQEKEGLSLIISKQRAVEHGYASGDIFKVITLEVHSSLSAVGLTAAFATVLSEAGISANVVAGYYHDHIFVQTEAAEKALKALKELSGPHAGCRQSCPRG